MSYRKALHSLMEEDYDENDIDNLWDTIEQNIIQEQHMTEETAFEMIARAYLQSPEKIAKEKKRKEEEKKDKIIALIITVPVTAIVTWLILKNEPPSLISWILLGIAIGSFAFFLVFSPLVYLLRSYLRELPVFIPLKGQWWKCVRCGAGVLQTDTPPPGICPKCGGVMVMAVKL